MKINDRLFAWQCIKDEPIKCYFGLCSTHKYKIGDWITDDGKPGNYINDACINKLEDYNLEEIFADREDLNILQYFRKIEIELKIKL